MVFMGYAAGVNLLRYFFRDGRSPSDDELKILCGFLLPCTSAVGVDNQVTTAYVFFKTGECWRFWRFSLAVLAGGPRVASSSALG
jgi:hypothetical protein